VCVRWPVFLLLVLCAACTERRLWIKTEPAGATVRVNGREIGRTPTVWRFDHYGRVLVELEMDGYLPEHKIVHLKTPAREYYTLGGFLTDVIYPGTVEDNFEVDVALKPVPKLSEQVLDDRIQKLAEAAARMRGQAETAAEEEEARAKRDATEAKRP